MLGGEKSKGEVSHSVVGPRSQESCERAGWYAVNVSANDVATSGNRPEFMQSIILPARGRV